MSDTGTATLGMSVARGLRRKMKTTSTTRMMDPISVRLDVAHRGTNGGGAIHHDGCLDALRQDSLKKRKLRLDAVVRYR